MQGEAWSLSRQQCGVNIVSSQSSHDSHSNVHITCHCNNNVHVVIATHHHDTSSIPNLRGLGVGVANQDLIQDFFFLGGGGGGGVDHVR